MDQTNIRNFSIIAHIDHGKSTLADRLLELTGTISARDMTDQVLDSMDLERERGVTIKASAVRIDFDAKDGQTYQLNLIDTPGHVDFSYEVSRALAACEGAVLVVDASQGIEAQTLANLFLALDADLEIVPVVNKIDLAAARTDEIAEEIADLLGLSADSVIQVSAKEGTNAKAVLEEAVARIPAPNGQGDGSLRALIFDSHYDPYKGVIAYVRVVDGAIEKGKPLRLMATGAQTEPLEVGVFAPQMKPTDRLGVGEVGYLATGLKTVRECRVGDTLTDANNQATEALPGYRPAKPMVFAGIFPTEPEEYAALREALERLRLNDAALTYEPENSQALQFGFRAGFLGLFHMEIVQERLEREYDLDLIATAPSVAYQVVTTKEEIVEISSPADLPDPSTTLEIREPWMRVQIYAPAEYIGPIMELMTRRRAEVGTTEYLDSQRVVIDFDMPLSEMIIDLHDRLKSATRGYASLDYEFDGYRPGELVKLNILINKMPVDALAMIMHRDQAYDKGSALVDKLKEVIPRQMFPVPIQAAVGSRIIARTTVKALRKDVLAKCYGGDVSRKRKLLERQKAGKKRMKQIGQVAVPQEAFLALLRLEE